MKQMKVAVCIITAVFFWTALNLNPAPAGAEPEMDCFFIEGMFNMEDFSTSFFVGNVKYTVSAEHWCELYVKRGKKIILAEPDRSASQSNWNRKKSED